MATSLTWAERFVDYDRKNPRVWDMFVRFTKQMLAAGHRRLGAAMIIDRIRWETMVRAEGDRFKINQNYARYYGRKFVEQFPEHPGVFSFRDGWAVR